MNIDILLKITGGELLNKKTDKKINNIQIDSRKVSKNDLFIAIKGNDKNGHDYIKEAINKKPTCIMVCENIKVKTKIPIIKVLDTKEALMQLGSYFRSKYDIPVIAVTGSVGKTTTKELISLILSKKYKVLKSDKNYNNHIGLPLTLFKLNKEYDICVFEIGMNHQGEISNLSKMCQPNIGVITNIGTSHIGNLGSQENIFKAKMEILDGMNDGLLIVNGKDKYLKKIKYPNIIKCGIKLKPYEIIVDDKTSFKLVINNEVHKFSYNSNNKQLLTNFLLAIQVGLLFKIDINDIKDVLNNYTMPKERMHVCIKNTTKIIDDCYNASLESVRASLETLKHDKNKKIVILGDILELGTFSYKIHKQIQKYLKKIKNKEVLLVGEATKNIKGKQCIHFLNNQQIINYLKNINLKNTTILIKGSRKMHLEEISNYLKLTL